MSISIIIASKSESKVLLTKLLTEEFLLDVEYSKNIIENADYGIIKHFDQLINSCYLLAETNYIDKVYRDSYYHYYSTKLTRYQRNCVRISIFDSEIKKEDFKNELLINELQKKYLGFIILRPTDPNVIGRSIISPKALKVNHFNCCTAKFQTTSNSIKFQIEGFPHSSQVTETIS